MYIEEKIVVFFTEKMYNMTHEKDGGACLFWQTPFLLYFIGGVMNESGNWINTFI